MYPWKINVECLRIEYLRISVHARWNIAFSDAESASLPSPLFLFRFFHANFAEISWSKTTSYSSKLCGRNLFFKESFFSSYLSLLIFTLVFYCLSGEYNDITAYFLRHFYALSPTLLRKNRVFSPTLLRGPVIFSDTFTQAFILNFSLYIVYLFLLYNITLNI